MVFIICPGPGSLSFGKQLEVNVWVVGLLVPIPRMLRLTLFKNDQMGRPWSWPV